MYYFPVGFGVLLHVLFWGAGAGLLLMPRAWRAFWPVLIVPAGLALQSIVVWVGAYANLRGTDSYTWWSELVPAGLLAVAMGRRGGVQCALDLRRFSSVGLAMAGCLGVLLTVLAVGAGGAGLTTVSLGSCDAADYAAGARVLKEFAHADRQGFIGLTEVVQVMSADDFFDYWLRLNHFTPAALIALNGTALDCSPAEITGVLTAVLLASSLPLVFWMARAVMGYCGRQSVWIAVIYGLSPITWYALAHVAMGQLLAAQAIVLLTWAGIASWRRSLQGPRAWRMFGVLFIGYALVLGSYTFILPIVLVPAVAVVGGAAAWGGQWRRLFGWASLMVVPLVAVSGVFAERIAGMAERFILFQTYDFGWRIPFLSPEGWLGLVSGPGLNPFPLALRVVLATAVVGLIAVAFALDWRQRRGRIALALGLSIPALVGYGWLSWRGYRLGTNASYDAYKVLAVFYPGLLAAACYWLALQSRRGMVGRLIMAGLAGGVTAANGWAAWQFSRQLASPPLMVTRPLRELSRIEAMPDVASVNLLMPDMWARLWANEFLLRTPQYFPLHSYEGRRDTPLRGQWDLTGDLVHVQLPQGQSHRLNSQFSLVDTRSRFYLRAQPSTDWFDLERPPLAVYPWRWTREVPTILLENPHAYPLRAVVRLTEVQALVERDLEVWQDGRSIGATRISGDGKNGSLTTSEIVIPAGASTLEIKSRTALAAPNAGDSRLVGFRIFGIEVEVLPILPTGIVRVDGTLRGR